MNAVADRIAIYDGDCLDGLPTLAANSIDACICDPPYNLISINKRFGQDGSAAAQYGTDGRFQRLSGGFMSAKWDSTGIAFRPEVWREVYRVLKPGAHLLAFGGTRTYHRMVCAIEDAGFEIRDTIMWLYGSGFPKSHDVSKGIDKARNEDEPSIRAICRVIRQAMDNLELKSKDLVQHFDGCHPRLIDHWAARDTDSQPALPTWQQWQKLQEVLLLDCSFDEEVMRLNERKGEPSDDWKSASILGEHQGVPGGFGDHRFNYRDKFIREPSDAARQWQGFGTALKPACEPIVLARKPLSEGTVAANVLRWNVGAINVDGCRIETDEIITATRNYLGGAIEPGGMEKEGERKFTRYEQNTSGRWPANVITDGSAEVLAGFPESDGQQGALRGTEPSGTFSHVSAGPLTRNAFEPRGDSGSAARFFKSCPFTDEDLRWARTRHGDVSIQEQTDGCDVGENREAVDSTDNLKTDGYGNASTDQSQMDSMSITSITTAQTTDQETSDLFGGRNTTPTTNDYGKPIEPSRTEILAESASDAGNGNRSISSTRERPEHSTATVSHANESISQNGEKKTGSIGTPTIENTGATAKRFHYTSKADSDDRLGSKHPTVKPLDLMQYLVRLICPPGGTVLDCFAGTGTTGEAAFREGMRAVLIEREAEYQADIRRRMELLRAGPDQRAYAAAKERLKDKPRDDGPLFGGVAE